MIRTLVAFVLLGSLAPLTAQQSLNDLQRRFAEQARTLGENPTREAVLALRGQQIASLRTFVEQTAAGDDRWNGRLMLADFQLANGDREAAGTTLQAIDTTEAPALVLTTTALMAQHLGLDDLRARCIGAAAAKEAPLADRLAIARLLLTVLHEVDRGEAIYRAALTAAKTDEDRALVRWHRADAMRDREDLPDNAGFDELQKLATDLPDTSWGDIARDRLRATRLRPGDDPIHFRATTRDGSTVATKELLGKAVVLLFWSAQDRDLPRLLETLRALQQRAGDKLVVLGICLDRESARIDADVERLGIKFPVIGDGKGAEHDVALRWFVEGPQVHVIDTAGKVAGLGLHAGTADGRAQLTEVIERAAGL